MIPCVRFRPSVTLDPMTPALARLLGALDGVARTVAVDLLVTCGREGHASGSHPTGAALDVSAAGMSPETVVQVYQLLKGVLGERFYVQYETQATPVNGALKNIAVVSAQATGPHFHLQVDRGTVYPPQDAELAKTNKSVQDRTA